MSYTPIILIVLGDVGEPMDTPKVASQVALSPIEDVKLTLSSVALTSLNRGEPIVTLILTLPPKDSVVPPAEPFCFNLASSTLMPLSTAKASTVKLALAG